MPPLLEQLLHDLLQRFRFLYRELDNLQNLPVDVIAYRDRIRGQVDRASRITEGLLADPDLGQPDFARNIFHHYKRLAELAQAVDEGPVFVLSRFQEADIFLTRLVTEMCREMGFQETPPICAAMSTQYYCTITGMDLLFVPHSEPSHLLGLPDIYHELGHMILFRHSATLLARLRDCAHRHFQSEIIRARQEGWPATSIEALENYRQRWLGDWSLEFGCDLIATYVCGPAFGWTNVRLCARLSPDFFEILFSHPADAARTSAIRIMLEDSGHGGEAQRIDDHWSSLRSTAAQVEPQEFRLAFPEALLKSLVSEVRRFCPSVGLKPFDPQSMPVANLLNDAWLGFLTDPANYASWEEQEIKRLRSMFHNA